MATITRDWILAAGAVPAAGAVATLGMKERFKEKIVVDEVEEETTRGWMLVIGRVEEGGAMRRAGPAAEEWYANDDTITADIDDDVRRWILIGSSGERPRSRGDHHQGSILQPGSVVGIREPFWDVDANGQRWNVAVRWDVAKIQGDDVLSANIGLQRRSSKAE